MVQMVWTTEKGFGIGCILNGEAVCQTDWLPKNTFQKGQRNAGGPPHFARLEGDLLFWTQSHSGPKLRYNAPTWLTSLTLGVLYRKNHDVFQSCLEWEILLETMFGKWIDMGSLSIDQKKFCLSKAQALCPDRPPWPAVPWTKKDLDDSADCAFELWMSGMPTKQSWQLSPEFFFLQHHLPWAKESAWCPPGGVGCWPTTSL